MKKLDTVKIWIIAEIAAIVLLVIAVLMKTVFAGNKEEEPRYTMPGTGTQTVSDEDIVIPYDLMEGEFEEEESGEAEDTEDLYAMDYPEEVLDKLVGMDTAQKVSMLIVTSPEVLCDVDKVTQTGDVFHKALTDRPVSGLIMSDSNYGSEAEGMKMLKTLREWSRESTGMNILLGYREQGDTAAGELSDRGYNLYCIPGGSEDSAQKGEEAASGSMIPAITLSLADAMALPMEDMLAEAGAENAPVIAQTGSADDAADAIIAGRTYLYSTDNMDLYTGLIEKTEAGDIPAEALDHAAGYAISVRMGLTAMRSEDMEKVPEEETKVQEKSSSAKKTAAKKEEKKKTPEEEAAEAAQKAMEEAAKEQQRQAEAAQKAMEEAAKEQQKQLEAAAKAAQEAQKKQAEEAAKQAAGQ